MSGYSLYSVLVGVHTALVNSAPLLALLGTGDANSIYDNVAIAEDAVFPYIVTSLASCSEFNSKTSNGSDIIIRISAFSQSTDKSEVSKILEAVYNALQDSSLTISDNDFVLCDFSGTSNIFVDDTAEYLTHQGVIEFRILTT